MLLMVLLLLFLDLMYGFYWFNWFMILLSVSTFFGCSLYMPRSISIAKEHLIIKMLGKSKKIPLKDILSIEQIDAQRIYFSLRIFGIGGLFGDIGVFKNSRIGKYKRYTTSTDDLILITMKDDSIIVTNCSLDFMQEIEDIIKTQIPT